LQGTFASLAGYETTVFEELTRGLFHDDPRGREDASFVDFVGRGRVRLCVQGLWSEFSAASLVGGIELAVEGKRKKEKKAAEGTSRRERTARKNEADEEGRG